MKKVEYATALLWPRLHMAQAAFRRHRGAELPLVVYTGAQYRNGLKWTMRTLQPIAV